MRGFWDGYKCGVKSLGGGRIPQVVRCYRGGDSAKGAAMVKNMDSIQTCYCDGTGPTTVNARA